MSEETNTPADLDVARLAELWQSARKSDGLSTFADAEAAWCWRFCGAPGALEIGGDATGGVDADGFVALIPAQMLESDERARWCLTSIAGAADASAAAAKAFIRANGGMGDGVHTFYLLHAERTGELLRHGAGFETVRNQNRLMLAADLPRVESDIEIVRVEAWSAELADLFAVPIAGDRAQRARDEAWFQWRFLDAPENDYELIVARSGDLSVGFAASTTATLCGERATWALDWHVRGALPGVSRAMAQELAERAERDGAARVGWLLPDTVPEWIELQGLGARIESTPWFLDVRTFSRQTTDRWMQQNWAYTLADFDLV